MAVVNIEVQVQGNVEWRCFRGRGGSWVAVCDALALTVQSETYASLMEDIADTLNGILHDLVPSGELERFLRERGWRLVAPMPSAEDSWFDVPFVTRTADRDREAVLR